MALPVKIAKAALPPALKVLNLVALYDRLPKQQREKAEEAVKKWVAARRPGARLQLALATAASLEAQATSDQDTVVAKDFAARARSCETSLHLVAGLRGPERAQQRKRVQADLDALYRDMLAFTMQKESGAPRYEKTGAGAAAATPASVTGGQPMMELSSGV